MDQGREKQAIETKLARCRELAQEFRDGSIAQLIRDLEDELRQQIKELESGYPTPGRAHYPASFRDGISSCGAPCVNLRLAADQGPARQTPLRTLANAS